MNRGPLLILWLVATIALSAVTALWVVPRYQGRNGGAAADDSETDFHTWMHEHLNISPEQHAQMQAAETVFEKERGRLRGEIRTAGRELAEGIRNGAADAPEVRSPLARLNKAQGELQQATLAHFFAMKQHLRPEQAEKLLQWTHDSITREHLD